MDECTQKQVRHLSDDNSVSGQNDGWCKCTISTLKLDLAAVSGNNWVQNSSESNLSCCLKHTKAPHTRRLVDSEFGAKQVSLTFRVYQNKKE